jgi:protein TonB
MEKDKRKTRFVYQPEYPGGPKELTKFLYSNLRYPKDALSNRIEGVVYMEYDIDNKGVVVATRVLKGLGHGCDEEAARVVKMLRFTVAKNRGIHVLFHQKVRIKFKLPEEKPTQQAVPQQVNYSYTVTTTVTQTASAQEQQEQGGTTTYSYTITF